MEHVFNDEFVNLLGFEDRYEIEINYPHTIRKKADGIVINEYINSNGYVAVNLNGRSYLKHRLIALQFIPNDDPVNKTDCDHRSRVRSDYHISNLRWAHVKIIVGINHHIWELYTITLMIYQMRVLRLKNMVSICLITITIIMMISLMKICSFGITYRSIGCYILMRVRMVNYLYTCLVPMMHGSVCTYQSLRDYTD